MLELKLTKVSVPEATADNPFPKRIRSLEVQLRVIPPNCVPWVGFGVGGMVTDTSVEFPLATAARGGWNTRELVLDQVNVIPPTTLPYTGSLAPPAKVRIPLPSLLSVSGAVACKLIRVAGVVEKRPWAKTRFDEVRY